MATKAEKTPGEAIADLKKGQFTTLAKVIPSGALQARKLSTGAVKLYWRYTFNGESDRVEIGLYDGNISPKMLKPKDGRWNIAAAMTEASRLALAHDGGKEQGGHAGLVKAKAEAEAKALADDAAAKAQAQAEIDRRSKYTLAELLKAYWLNLEALGRTSHRQARTTLTKHVINAWPEIAALPASEVASEQVADMLRRLFEHGKGRTANITRAYLGAAYETARQAKSDPLIPVAFKGFEVKHNPAAETKANTDANKADKNPLSGDEMRVYWNCIKDMGGIKGAALKLHLLTGGQRIEQLVRLKTADIAADTITIFDGKGRPGRPARRHTLPLTAQAAEAIKLLDLSGEYAITTEVGDKIGKTHLANTTLSAWAAEAVGDKITGFQAKRIRSGVETILASVKISKDTRGRLQSHGVSGVQDRHYDGYDYLPELRTALEALDRELNSTKAGNVVAIKAA
ncbi:integrase [Paucibacter sp. B2R-40]|uniref:integrase n=1 Tax=Paucibacter sp. B2R-40 TaxID=2893554 RepID=UPI0021E50277|nr:integrase [Paucibacter sp. B2R-40]MCV2354626.1 integrase [Paucibacter sp. B2R-40]